MIKKLSIAILSVVLPIAVLFFVYNKLTKVIIDPLRGSTAIVSNEEKDAGKITGFRCKSITKGLQGEVKILNDGLSIEVQNIPLDHLDTYYYSKTHPLGSKRAAVALDTDPKKMGGEITIYIYKDFYAFHRNKQPFVAGDPIYVKGYNKVSKNKIQFKISRHYIKETILKVQLMANWP